MDTDFNTSNLVKIDKDYLANISNNSILSYFGEWTNNIEILQHKFNSSQPFEHIVIDNFLEEKYAEKLSELFPKLDNTWYEYKNPIEVKYAFDDVNKLPLELKNYFYYLSTPEITNIIILVLILRVAK